MSSHFSIDRSKKPGPRPNRCKWCSDINCSHCQCIGFEKCDHAPGQKCLREKYKRRLVCNPCEKNKLRFKRDPAISAFPINTMKRSISMDSGLNTLTSLANMKNLDKNKNEEKFFTDLIHCVNTEINKMDRIKSFDNLQKLNTVVEEPWTELEASCFLASMNAFTPRKSNENRSPSNSPVSYGRNNNDQYSGVPIQRANVPLKDSRFTQILKTRKESRSSFNFDISSIQNRDEESKSSLL